MKKIDVSTDRCPRCGCLLSSSPWGEFNLVKCTDKECTYNTYTDHNNVQASDASIKEAMKNWHGLSEETHD